MTLPVRRAYKGAAASTTTTINIGVADTAVSIASNTGWPSGANPFYVVLSPGTSGEEKCLATISGTSLTLTRAQDDTTAQTHASGTTIYPVFTADDADEANLIASKMTTKGDLITTDGSDINRLGVGTTAHALIADSTVTNGIKWGQIATAGITDGSVTTAKIAASAVDATKLATDSVTTVKIADSNVTTAKIANSAVTAAKIDSTAIISPTIVDAKGDLIAGTGADAVARLAVGTNDYVLTADSTQTTGMKWAAAATQVVKSITQASVSTSQTTTSSTFTDLTTSGPAVTVTTGTSVLVAITATCSNATAQAICLVGVAVSGATTTAAADADALYVTSSTSNGIYQVTALIPLTVTAGSNTFTLKYRVSAATTGTFANRRIALIQL